MIPVLKRVRQLPRDDLRQRPLKLLVGNLGEPAAPAASMLRQFSGHPLVEVWSTDAAAPYHMGLMPSLPIPAYQFHTPRSNGQGALLGPVPEPSVVRHDIAPWMPALISEEWLARSAELDAAVTDRFWVCWRHTDPVPRLNVLEPLEALALIGLKLRQQERLELPYGRARFCLTRDSYYWHATRMLLPASASWMAAGGPHRAHSLWLAQSVLVRVGRALHARDACQVECQFRPDMPGEAGLYHFDMLLVSLVGAMDAAARVINRWLDLGLPDKDAGWQKDTWRKRLGQQAPETAALLNPLSRGGALFKMARVLRNLVHADVFQFVGERHGESTTLLMIVPDEAEAPLVQCLEQLEATSGWGVLVRPGHRVTIHPPVFIEALSRQLLHLLNAVMASAARVAGPDAVPQSRRAFREEIEKMILALSGLTAEDSL